MIYYSAADEEQTALVRSVIVDNRPELDNLATFSVLVAMSEENKDGEPKSHPVVISGASVPAKVIITSYMNRVLGLTDLVFVLDGHQYPTMPKPQVRAAVDAALAGYELARDGDDGLVTDDLGRPKFKSRKPDATMRVFSDVLDRHGKHSLEATGLKELQQLLESDDWARTDDVFGAGTSLHAVSTEAATA